VSSEYASAALARAHRAALLAMRCAQGHRSDYWSDQHDPSLREALATLEAAGLVEPMGVTFGCTPLWRVTERGLAVIADEKEG